MTTMKFAFELKSTHLNTLVLCLHTQDWAEAQQFFQAKKEQYQQFSNIPFILDISVFECVQADDLLAFVNLLSQHNLNIIALRHEYVDYSLLAKEQGWLFLQKRLSGRNMLENEEINHCSDAEANSENQSQSVDVHQSAQLVRRTMVIDTPIRAGQQVYAENADLIILAMVSAGAEVIADGHIHVYAPMRGRALAGERGDKTARIFIQSMQAELVSIAGIYRVFEQNLPNHLHQKAVRIELQDDKLLVMAISV